jgi:aminoglycoside phosphotransferase family enzyme
VAFLGTPAAYPYRPLRVDVKETHMSWVFIAGDRVYKLKKPVRYPFLDFRTLAAREANCREEVRLNRRLAPRVYVGVVPLTKEHDGLLALAGRGEVVDWLVEMRRLPEELMLDRVILEHSIERDRGDRRIDAVADLLITFYRACPPADLSPPSYVQQFAREQAITEAVLSDPRFSLDRAQVGYALDRVRRGLKEDAAILEDRVKHGRIVEGHGDLRPEHICLSDPPVIIDCLEFNRQLRILDAASELSFLALECERLGAPEIGNHLINAYSEEADDWPSQELLKFYRIYHAAVRAKIAIWHLKDGAILDKTTWISKAEQYLRMAAGMTKAA